MLFFSLLAIPFQSVTSLPSGDGSSCKSVPGRSDWPSVESWKALNETLNGRLLAPVPPSIVCDPANKAYYYNDSCNLVGASWFDSSFHANDPVSVDWPNWQNDACLPTAIYNETVECDTEYFPNYVVNASQPEHVAAAIRFAGDTNVRLSVKATGHDFLGRSTAPGLSLWTNSIRGITWTASFRAKSGESDPGEPAMTIRSGERMRDIYAVAKRHNVTIVGGADPNVGLGGYLTGGGHSPISNQFGLVADNVLELEIATPTGEIVVANQYQNMDLFWAFNGGGGATFGVLISATIKTYSPFSITQFALTFNSTDSEAKQKNNNNFFTALAWLHTQLIPLSDAGAAGYSFLSTTQSPSSGYVTAQNLSPEPEPLSFGFYGGIINATESDILELFAPIVGRLNYTSGITTAFTTIPNRTLFDSAGTAPGFVGVNAQIGSRLWDAAALTNETALQHTLRAFEKVGLQGLFVSGPGVRNVPDQERVAVNPVWRRTYLHLTTAVSYPFRNASARAAQETFLTHTLTAALRDHAPDMGCYLNEADANEPEWQRAFFGDSYERLVAIKEEVDPREVFWCQTCVGSEAWRVQGD